MRIIKPEFQILSELYGSEILMDIEAAGRTCYKSEDRVSTDSAMKFVKGLIQRGHESVLEHRSVSVRIICDRGVSHEIVRHRIAAYSQESTRYCNYKGGVTFIAPCFLSDCPIGEYTFDNFVTIMPFDFSNGTLEWIKSMLNAERAYLTMLSCGMQPQEARSVLPNSLKTEIVCTYNLREWRHFFKLRAADTAGKPHPQMLEITVPMLEKFKQIIPVVFDDIEAVK